MLESFFKEYLDITPSFGSFLGIRSYDNRVENVLSKEYTKKMDALHAKYKAHMGKDASLDWIISMYNKGKRFDKLYPPISSFHNTIIDFTFHNTTLYPAMKSSQDVQKCWSRHKCFATFIEDCIKEFKAPRHFIMPRIICVQLIDTLKTYIETKAYMISYIDKNDATYKRFVRYLEEVYHALLVELVEVLSTSYISLCPDKSVGLVRHGATGKELYMYEIEAMTTMKGLSPDEIHEFGRKEVRRISKLMHRTKAQLGYSKCIPLNEFYKHMTHDPKWHLKSSEEIIKHYKRIQGVIDKEVVPKNFHKPVQPHDIKAVPKEMAKTSAGAFYYPGSQTRTGTFYINTRDPSECHTFSAYTLSLHEGNPGHHYQFQYMLENNVPTWKKYLIQNTAFTEGWALYSETLMDFSDKPADYFGRLTYDMFRAVRLVVDTGIHWYGWSFNRAVSYMSRHLAMAITEIETEVQRYISTPAQALCYKLGEREILSFRDIYMSRCKNADIKDFHELLLSDGVLPFQVLRDKVVKAACEHK